MADARIASTFLRFASAFPRQNLVTESHGTFPRMMRRFYSSNYATMTIQLCVQCDALCNPIGWGAEENRCFQDILLMQMHQRAAGFLTGIFTHNDNHNENAGWQPPVKSAIGVDVDHLVDVS